MATLELFATATTVGYILLTIKRNIWQFPIGLLATALFFVVFLEAKLYASTALQVLFAAVQVYGWWYWLHGDNGRQPRITSVSLSSIAVLGLCALVCAAALSGGLQTWTDARMALTDSAIFSLSAVGQFLLGRKIIEHWFVWMLVNSLAVWVYAAQELWITAALYVGLLASAIWGYREWGEELRAYGKAALVSQGEIRCERPEDQ